MVKRLEKPIVSIMLLTFLLSIFAITVSADIPENNSGIKISLGYRPGSVVMDGNNNVFVGDYDNGNLYKYKADGTLDTSWGNGGNAKWQGTKATDNCGMCFDKNGNIIITSQDYGFYVIDKNTGDILKTVPLLQALGCTIDSSGNIYFATNYGIYKYDCNFNLLYHASNTTNAYGIAVDNTGKIYYTNYINHTVNCLNSDFTINSAFGTNGNVSVFGDSTHADGLCYCNNTLYTCSESQYYAYVKALNMDGSNAGVIFEEGVNDGPINIFANNDYFAVVYWRSLYVKSYQRPHVNLDNKNLSTTLDKSQLSAGSNDSLHIAIT